MTQEHPERPKHDTVTVVYEGAVRIERLHDADHADADEDGNFLVVLWDDERGQTKMRIPLSRVVEVHE